jgi:short-subunit dehydrogenase
MTRAIVTGASSGLGREITRRLAARGDHVLAVARSGSSLEELAATTPHVTPLVADLSTAEGRDAVVAAEPEPDILVNNAGVGNLGAVASTPPAVLNQMVAVNVTALTDLTVRLLPPMVAKRRGRILNVASTAAFQPGPNMAVYFATKSYVLSFTEGLAHELRHSGVTATCFCPGGFASGFQERAGAERMRLLSTFSLPTSDQMAEAALRAMDRGEAVAIPGLLNKLGAVAPRVAPRRLVRAVAAWVATEA